MVIGPLVLANVSSKSSSSEDENILVKLKNALLRLTRRRKAEHTHDEACESECDKRQDESLHLLANRVHVVEFETDVETYGPEAARRKRKPQ